MRGRVVGWVIVLATGLAGGQFAWNTFFAPSAHDFPIGGNVVTIRPPEGAGGKNLYVRYEFHVPKRPRIGSVEVIAFDDLRVWLNGALIGREAHDGFSVSAVADITPQLQEGKNVLAAVVRQTTLSHPPELTVRGSYVLGEDEVSIVSDGTWRYRALHERTAEHWIATDFDDSEWPTLVTRERNITAKQETSPQAMTSPRRGAWVGPSGLDARESTVFAEFEVPEDVRHAWLRLQSTAPYRLAVNGTILATNEEQLGTILPPRSAEWIYDIAPVAQRGRNAVSLALTTLRPPPHVMVDIGVTGRSGKEYRFWSDENWRWREGIAPDWQDDVAVASATPVAVEQGDLGMLPWNRPRRDARDPPPPSIAQQRALRQTVFVAGCVLGLAALTWLTDRVLFRASARQRQLGLSPAALALLPTGVLAWLGHLMDWDPRIAAEQVYQPGYLFIGLLLAPAMWLLLAAIRGAAGATRPGTLARSTPSAWPIYLLLAGLVVSGTYMRVKDIDARPLSPDEVSMYRTTMGLLKRGWPSIEIHPDIPPVYASTSELVYPGAALASFVFQTDRLIIRAPAAVWGVATILIIYWCTARMFGRWAGLFTAAIYTFSPYCIAMANLGRYYSQLQATTLLVVYFFYQTIARDGPLNRKALWACVISFCAMFLSWEGSALIAVPMMLAAIILRRRDIRSLLADPHVYYGMFVIGVLVLAQGANRAFVQVGRPLFGSGASEVALTPMWLYPHFDLWYYVRSASPNRDMLLPMVLFFVALLLTVRGAHRKPARLLTIVFLGICIFQALFLPVTGKRYSYHLLPMWLMLAGAGLVAIGRALTSLRFTDRRALLPVARGMAAGFAALFLVLGSGFTIDLGDLMVQRTAGTNPDALNLPQQEPSTKFVVEHMQPGDLVIVNAPHVIDHYLGRPSDYWLQTLMRLQACLDDKRSVALHRLQGAQMLPDAGHVQDLVSRYDRIWFITEPLFNSRTNVPETSVFTRGHFTCVYEDFSSLVLFRGRIDPLTGEPVPYNIPASLRAQQEETLSETKVEFLP